MKISVVVPSYNQAKFLETTIRSVTSQIHANREIIVMDGGSQDGSVAILQQMRSMLTFRSEPDDGQVAAINEGFALAKGDVMTWLNSDDVLFDRDVLTAVASFFSTNPHVDAVFGDFVIIDHLGAVLRRRKEPLFDYNCLLYGYCFITPAIFLRRRTLEHYGPLDESYKYIFDWEYYLRLGKEGATVARLKQYLFGHRFHGESITVGTPEKQLGELRRLRAQYDWPAGRRTALARSNGGQRMLNLYYRAKRWTLRAVTRGQLYLPLSTRRILRNLGR